ncbi:MAG: hypothetical protein NTV49_12095 [Kiritimatiellaeota bacterium]|nr:hypothetical protein [Kiritimatiellota bacterium]
MDNEPLKQRARRGPHWRRHVIRQIIGWTVIVVGIIDLPLPGPGWLIIGMGALILAPYIKVFRRFADWIQRRFPALREPLRKFEEKHHLPEDEPDPPA